MGVGAHWDGIYRTRTADQLGWFEATPSTLADVLELAPSPDARIIDIGAGASRLVDELLRRGYRHVTLLDVSATALEQTQARLLDEGLGVPESVVGDVRHIDRHGSVDLWHDRAVFHFLVDDADRRAYVAAASRSVTPGGALVIATFSLDGPEQCAGLPVARYDAAGLAACFDADFELMSCRSVCASDPAGDTRPYVLCRFRRRSNAAD